MTTISALNPLKAYIVQYTQTSNTQFCFEHIFAQKNAKVQLCNIHVRKVNVT